jgi:RNA polymerase sigma factor (sigma-70 family)
MARMTEEIAGKRSFATTNWSVVVRAGDAERADARDALAELCEAYWYPLYHYVRRRGYDAPDAQDLTQGFFARLLDKHALGAADPDRGRFRAFLLASVDHFLANERERDRAKKRGGGQVPLSLDLAAAESRVDLEPAHDLTPERLYERQWALTVLALVIRRLEAEYRESRKTRQFERLKDSLGGAGEGLRYGDIASELGMTVENTRQAAHRMRRRFRALLRDEVARTVVDPDDVDEELASLFQALRG